MTAPTHTRRDRIRDTRPAPRIVVGVDTHKHVHVAVALDELGTVLANLTITADRDGYDQLLSWAIGLGRIVAFGIEGTGSYGAALAGAARRRGHPVVEPARIAVNDACAARTTCSTRRTPPALCCPAAPLRHPSTPMAWWSRSVISRRRRSPRSRPAPPQ